MGRWKSLDTKSMTETVVYHTVPHNMDTASHAQLTSQTWRLSYVVHQTHHV